MASNPKCAHCRKKYQQTKVDQKYCTSKCRQAAYRRRHAPKKPKKRVVEKALFAATCLHCSNGFWAKTKRALYCGVSCRTMGHRALKASIPAAISEVYGIPEERAAFVVETQPIAQVKRLLETKGFYYVPSIRRWLNSSTQVHA